MPVLADAPMLTISIEAAMTLGSLVGGGVLGAAKLIVGYLRERDAARDKADATREQVFADKLTRELKDRTDLATRFVDEVSHIEAERRDTTKQLIAISRETAAILAQTEAALRSISIRIGHTIPTQHPRKRDDETD